MLIHFDPSLLIRLAADALTYGMRAVISHILRSGGEQQIAFVSQTLMSSERNYAQIEKEAVVLVFGVK